ncbi:hypothetical protein MP228_007432 [Amoeboaphelidium protococcarum]|nr:hypothetical protein MP228_007432 [Amoeboaphelidium protococcarum]
MDESNGNAQPASGEDQRDVGDRSLSNVSDSVQDSQQRRAARSSMISNRNRLSDQLLQLDIDLHNGPPAPSQQPSPQKIKSALSTRSTRTFSSYQRPIGSEDGHQAQSPPVSPQVAFTRKNPSRTTFSIALPPPLSMDDGDNDGYYQKRTRQRSQYFHSPRASIAASWKGVRRRASMLSVALKHQTIDRWDHWSRKKKIAISLIFFCCISLVIVLPILYREQNCNIQGCRTEYLYSQLASRMTQGVDAYIYPQNYGDFGNVKQILDYAVSSMSIFSTAVGTYFDLDKIRLINMTFIDTDDPLPTLNPRLQSMPTSKSTLPIGKAICGKLSPQSPILGFLPSNYEAVVNSISSSDNQLPQVQISNWTNTKVDNPSTQQSVGNLKPFELASCCIQFLSDKARSRMHKSDVHVRVGCVGGAEAGGGLWIGMNNMLQGHQLPDWTDRMKSGQSSNDVFHRDASVVSVSSINGKSYSRGMQLSGSTRWSGSLLPVLSSLSGHVMTPLNMTLSSFIPFTEDKGELVLNTRSMLLSTMLSPSEIDVSRIVPQPWTNRVGACGNSLPIVVDYLNAFDEEVIANVTFSGSSVLFQGSGCPQNYIRSNGCWLQDALFNVNANVAYEDSILTGSSPQKLAVLRFYPTMLITQTGNNVSLPRLQTNLYLRHSSNRKRDKVNVYALYDQNCVLREEEQPVSGFWDSFNFFKRQSQWRAVSLGRQENSRHVSTEGKKVVWSTSSRSGEIVLVADYDAASVIEVRLELEGCPAHVCQQSEWVRFNTSSLPNFERAFNWTSFAAGYTQYSSDIQSTLATIGSNYKSGNVGFQFNEFQTAAQMLDAAQFESQWFYGHSQQDTNRNSSRQSLLRDQITFAGPFNADSEPVNDVINTQLDAVNIFQMPLQSNDTDPQVPGGVDATVDDSAKFRAFINASLPLITAINQFMNQSDGSVKNVNIVNLCLSLAQDLGTSADSPDITAQKVRSATQKLLAPAIQLKLIIQQHYSQIIGPFIETFKNWITSQISQQPQFLATRAFNDLNGYVKSQYGGNSSTQFNESALSIILMTAMYSPAQNSTFVDRLSYDFMASQLQELEKVFQYPSQMPWEIQLPLVSRGQGIDLSLLQKVIREWLKAKTNFRNAWASQTSITLIRTIMEGIQANDLDTLQFDSQWLLGILTWANLNFDVSNGDFSTVLTRKQLNMIEVLLNVKDLSGQLQDGEDIQDSTINLYQALLKLNQNANQ